ncbi:MAG: menaquinone-dependent protoporphyrinogen IX dehydrogenase [Burkholderiales bacterium]|nr:menaquinone-dependent protoporphyrinogen IX dehydrogenase [Burkholderiales bacterium]
MLCSSTDGHTRRICERLRTVVEQAGDTVSLVRIEDAPSVPLESYDMVVVGARVRYGRTDARVIDYANRHAKRLNALPSAFFSVNVTARKPDKDHAETNPYVQAFLRRVKWQPWMLDVFAGKIDYPRYSWLDRTVIRFIMWLTNGPTDPRAVVDFTDWERVDAFGQQLVRGNG